MVDFKALLPGHKQTQAEGGSSYTHPLGLPTDKHNPPHDSHGGQTADSDYTGPAGSAAHSQDEPLTTAGAQDRAAVHQGQDVSSSAGVGTTRGAEDIAAARQDYEDQPLSTTGTQDRATVHRDLPPGSTGGAGATRDASDIAAATQNYTEDRSGQVGRGTGATGLETSDPYKAAAQAGALLDKNDISDIDREVAAGGLAGAGAYGAQRQADGRNGAAGEPMPYASSNQTENSTPAHGLNAGVSDPVAVSGDAPISEPIHQDRNLVDSAAGRDESSFGATGAGLRGERGVGGGSGLIHGHHTTITGEKLDPHLSGQ